jgi:hypothetical protein
MPDSLDEVGWRELAADGDLDGLVAQGGAPSSPSPSNYRNTLAEIN